MTHRHTLWTLMFPAAHLCNQMEILMTQNEDLNAAIAQVGTDLGEAVTRIEAKLAEADVDLTDEIAQLRGYSDQLDGLGADPVEEPVDPEEPVEPPLEP